MTGFLDRLLHADKSRPLGYRRGGRHAGHDARPARRVRTLLPCEHTRPEECAHGTIGSGREDRRRIPFRP